LQKKKKKKTTNSKDKKAKIKKDDEHEVEEINLEEDEAFDWSSMVSGEFHSIEQETDKPYDYGIALRRENLKKNRYGNALPNPETRVKLLNGEDSDYINANYVKGIKTNYIAAQAPLTNTFADFWLMVYEQNTRVIMMLTKLQEKDKAKADVYWPRKGPLASARGPGKGGDESRWKAYGAVSVMLEKTEEVNTEITLRYFRIRPKNAEEGPEHAVVQIHYTGWPDFGTPEDTSTFKLLLELMEKHNGESIAEDIDVAKQGPIVMHCSAGLGRTGTLIAFHIASEKLELEQARSKEEIDMKEIVTQLREQRAGMVQTSSQYKFLYALLKDL